MRVDSFSLSLLLYACILLPLIVSFPHPTVAAGSRGGNGSVAGSVPVSDGPTVRKHERWPLESSEFGEISAVKISDGRDGGSYNYYYYYLQFITMNPGSLFLPVYMYSDMLFYVNSGNGTLSWMNVKKDDDGLQQVTLQRGDIFRLSSETIFYLQNNVQSYGYWPEKLQIYAIFPGSETKLQSEQLTGAYISVRDLVLGFDDQVLRSTLDVSEEVIKELRGVERQPLIVEEQAQVKTFPMGLGSWGIRALLGINSNNLLIVGNNKEAYNIYNMDRDVDTCFGWTATVTRKELDVLKHTDFGVFMVNLTKGSMMGPHWNPKTDAVAIVVQGRGMIQVVCPGIANETKCKNSRLKVEEGDLFMVPRNHPMAQMSFSNDSFVFMGFKLVVKKERPQYLTGEFSIIKMLDRTMLQKSFNVTSTTIDRILSPEEGQVIVECTSCAEEEEVAMESEKGEHEEEEGGGGESPEEGGGGGGESPEEGGGGGGESTDEGGGGESTVEGGGGGESSEEGGGGESTEEGGGGGESPNEGGGSGEVSPKEGDGGRGESSEEGGESAGESPKEGGGGEEESPKEGGGGEDRVELPDEGGGGDGGAWLPNEGGRGEGGVELLEEGSGGEDGAWLPNEGGEGEGGVELPEGKGRGTSGGELRAEEGEGGGGWFPEEEGKDGGRGVLPKRRGREQGRQIEERGSLKPY